MTHVKDLFNLGGKVALVTGGGRGIGYFSAEGLVEAGANVAICGRDIHGKLDDAVKKLNNIRNNCDCMAIKCDVTIEDDVKQMVRIINEHYGRCDTLINNVGIIDMRPTKSFTVNRWNEIMTTNLTSMFLCCKHVGKMMIKQQSGTIINFSSENGHVGFSIGTTAYATTKIGVIGLTRSLAVEWGMYNIRVNAIVLGHMEEGMMETIKDKDSILYRTMGDQLLNLTPIKRFGNIDDVKGSIVFLSSDASNYISGTKIVVDGGYTINGGI